MRDHCRHDPREREVLPRLQHIAPCKCSHCRQSARPRADLTLAGRRVAVRIRALLRDVGAPCLAARVHSVSRRRSRRRVPFPRPSSASARRPHARCGWSPTQRPIACWSRRCAAIMTRPYARQRSSQRDSENSIRWLARCPIPRRATRPTTSVLELSRCWRATVRARLSKRRPTFAHGVRRSRLLRKRAKAFFFDFLACCFEVVRPAITRMCSRGSPVNNFQVIFFVARLQPPTY